MPSTEYYTKDIIEQFFYTLPEEKLYLFQQAEDQTGKNWHTNCSTQWMNDIALFLPNCYTYEDAFKLFRENDLTCRIVKISRYIANDKFVVKEVVKYKDSFKH